MEAGIDKVMEERIAKRIEGEIQILISPQIQNWNFQEKH
jgi:hypothetical protein